MSRGDEDASGIVARVGAQIRAVAREADAAPGRSRRLGTAVLLIALLFSIGGVVISIVVAGRTSGLESADRLRDRSQQRLDNNRAALGGLNLCLARLGERTVPEPVVDPDEADSWVAARSAALGRLVDRGAGCPEQGVPAPPAPTSRTSSSSSTTTPRTSSAAPSRSATPRVPSSPGAGTAAPGAAAPGGAGAAGTPGAPGAPGAPGPAGPAAPAPAPRPALIPLLPRPLLPPLL